MAQTQQGDEGDVTTTLCYSSPAAQRKCSGICPCWRSPFALCTRLMSGLVHKSGPPAARAGPSVQARVDYANVLMIFSRLIHASPSLCTVMKRSGSSGQGAIAQISCLCQKLATRRSVSLSASNSSTSTCAGDRGPLWEASDMSWSQRRPVLAVMQHDASHISIQHLRS